MHLPGDAPGPPPHSGPAIGETVFHRQRSRAVPRPLHAMLALALCCGALPLVVFGRGTTDAYAATPVHIYVAGDSTASTYTTSQAPRTGWGQALPVFLNSNAVVVN